MVPTDLEMTTGASYQPKNLYIQHIYTLHLINYQALMAIFDHLSHQPVSGQRELLTITPIAAVRTDTVIGDPLFEAALLFNREPFDKALCL